MINSALLKSTNLVGRNVLAIQRRTFVGTPPLVRMNIYKKIAIGSAMCLTPFIIPAYIMVNIKYYNKSAKE